MKANELRIGNYIQFMEDSTVFKVEEILEYGLSVQSETEATYIEFDQFSGIQLTEEILLKSGFEFDTENCLWIKDANGYSFEIEYAPTSKTFTFYGIEIKYVHNLQNAFALTGEELEITI